MIPRIAIVLAAAAVVVLALTRHADAGACQRALTDSYHLAQGRPDAPRDVAARLADRCRGGDELASAAAALATRRPVLARSLALRATRREPDSARAWLSLAFALRRTDPPGARAAQARASALNPYAARVAP